MSISGEENFQFSKKKGLIIPKPKEKKNLVNRLELIREH